MHIASLLVPHKHATIRYRHSTPKDLVCAFKLLTYSFLAKVAQAVTVVVRIVEIVQIAQAVQHLQQIAPVQTVQHVLN